MTPLTGKSILEEDIENVMLDCIKSGNENTTYWAHRIANEVAKRYIEKAVEYVIEDNITHHKIFRDLLIKQYRVSYEQWAKENGIIGASLFPNKEETKQ